jgi:4-hydroxythreonine-4-phosphate dehydrogenase
VTAPLNKEAIHLAGYSFPGHTEILAERTGTMAYAMLFVSEPLNVILTTIHCALSEVPRLMTAEKLESTIHLGAQAMRQLGVAAPRIAVAGLNPHAGEAGRFGNEETTVMLPVIRAFQGCGYSVEGPFPADTLFRDAVAGRYDLVVAQYHDQGLIPLKLLAFDSAVNVTVGTPVIRTSPDHGTAYAIAGKGIAKPESLIAAIRLAARLAETR